MEDKRTALAVLLCMFVLMFWMEMVIAPYSRQSANLPANNAQPPASQETTPQTATGTNQNKAPNRTAKPLPVVKTEAPSPAEIEAAGKVVINTPLFKTEISKLGGRVTSFLLNQHKATKQTEKRLDMILVGEKQPFPLGISIGDFNDYQVRYDVARADGAQVTEGEYSLEKGGNLLVELSGQLPDATTIKKVLSFSSDSYLIGVSVQLDSSVAGGAPVWLMWDHYNAGTSTNQSLSHDAFTMLGTDNKVKITELSEVTAEELPVGVQQWISYGDRYFMSTLIPQQPGSLSVIGKNESTYYSKVSAPQSDAQFHVYVGPKSHAELQQAGYQLERNVDLGMFTFIAQPLLVALNFFYSLLGNYGLAIILLTLTIKCAFFPLTKSSMQSMKAMQTLQPEMKALRERIQDPTQLNQEMMALYKKHGVNPMGGCFPMLIQLPVFLGLYNALNNAIELRHAPFALWIDDLSSVERLDVFGIGIPVMVLLMGASMFLQQWTTPSAVDPQQKKIMMMMPVIFTISFVIFPFPSGLVLYWLVNNLISIIQQWYLTGNKKGSALQGTVVASVIIFFCGYLLTLM